MVFGRPNCLETSKIQNHCKYGNHPFFEWSSLLIWVGEYLLIEENSHDAGWIFMVPAQNDRRMKHLSTWILTKTKKTGAQRLSSNFWLKSLTI